MSRRRDDVTVLVEESGRVFVNGVLCAEHAVGVVVTRDELVTELGLHRVAAKVLGGLDQLAHALEAMVARDVAPGFIDGFNGVANVVNGASLPVEHGADYLTGYSAGRLVAAMRGHLTDLKSTVDQEVT